MSIKKWLTGLVVFPAMMVVLTTLGTYSVVAQTSNDNQPAVTVQAVDVQLNDDSFNPKVITIPNGKATKLILKNAGVKEHTFTVEKLGIDEEIQPGKEVTITVNPKKPGTYELICRYHYREGMVGQVVVQ
ncbi:cupredoxin domain-containing protein [Neobacillus sp. D3-1R]|uniref:cupredoxin domain-containing protein n=1 Tax=Neobacillus sp. D3-1R TaxID=3445778 RepID=UPI003F9F18B8